MTARKTGPQQPIKTIGGFEIISKLGQGGMGAVFKARQISLDRVVAVKVLTPSIAQKDPVFVDRFIREARASAKLNHPGIVQGIEVGTDAASGLHYFAMEYIDGPTVQKALEQQKVFSERRALEIVRDVAEALSCAHKAAMVHRDIKPDNILMPSRGGVKLADLGLAKVVTERGGDLPHLTNAGQASLTRTGMAVGTPNYMSPEQAKGEKTVDIRSDLYSLGATLFHMVVGRPPYAAPGKSADQILVLHITAPVPSARKENPQVSEATSKLIERLMQKDPARRIQTPDALMDEAEKILKTDPEKHSTTRARSPVKREFRGGDTSRGAAPIRGAHTAHGERAAESGGPPAALWGGLAAGAVLLIAVMALGGSRSPVPAPAKAKVESVKSPEIRPLAVIKSSSEAAPKPVNAQTPQPAGKSAEPADASGGLAMVAQERWREAAAALDLPAARGAFLEFLKEKNVPPQARAEIQGLLNEDLDRAAGLFSNQLLEWARAGRKEEAEKKLAGLKFEAGEDGVGKDAQGTLAGLREKLTEAKPQPALAAVQNTALPPADLKDPKWTGLLDKLSAAFLAGKPDDAKKLLGEAERDLQMGPWRAEITRQRNALAWLQELDQAATERLREFITPAEGKEIILAFKIKSENFRLGLGQSNQLTEVEKGDFKIKSIHFRLDSLSRDTRLKLALGPSPEPMMLARAAYAALAHWGEKDANPVSWRTIGTLVADPAYTNAPEDARSAVHVWQERVEALMNPPDFKLDCGSGVILECVRLPAGSFTMGSAGLALFPPNYLESKYTKFDDIKDSITTEMPAHKVTLSDPFYLGKFEVTQEQYQAVLGQNPSANKQGGKWPVEQVAYIEAQRFCERLSSKNPEWLVQLPTEAQWEYAAKFGGAGSWFVPWQENEDAKTWEEQNCARLSALGKFATSKDVSTQAVDQCAPTAAGLYGMFGNVAEWCRDYWSPYKAAPDTDPYASERVIFPRTQIGYRVMRGGHAGNFFHRCRPEARLMDGLSAKGKFSGFRVMAQYNRR